MDPAGIREILLVRPHVHNPYQFELVTRGLPYKTRIRAHHSSIPWLPLSEPLPQRVSKQSESYAGYCQYDCMILAGTDLESCTERDIRNIRSAAERGLPILICGGIFGLGRSYRLWHDLEEVLPARIPACEPEACDGDVVRAASHPILSGLPSSFGKVASVHPTEPAHDAAVLLSANGRPVLMASERFGGRQLILAVADAGGFCWDGLESEGFYGHPFYPDLVRQALTWLMRVETPLGFDGLELETGLSLDRPGEHVFQVTARSDEAIEDARLCCRVYAVDEARLMSGGDTVRTTRLHEEVRPLKSPVQRESFRIEDPQPRRNSGLYEVELALEMDEPPRTPPQGSFAMAAPPEWTDWKGHAVAVRHFRLRFPDQRKTRLMIPGWKCTVEEDEVWSVRADAPEGSCLSLTVTDEQGLEVGRVEAETGPEPCELTWPSPPLVEGDYAAKLDVRLPDGTAEEHQFALKFVAPPDPNAGFQLVGHFRGDTAGEDELHERIRTCLDAFGLDTMSVGGMAQADEIWDCWVQRRPSLAARRTRWLDAAIASHRQNLWTDFDKRLIVLETHGASKVYAPTTPCVHRPGYEEVARADLTAALRLQASRAGLISTEIIDEPHLYPSNVCRCDLCQDLYRRRYDEPLPTWEELIGDQTSRRWHFFEWLEDYTTRAFAMTQKIKREVAPELHLHNVAIDRLFTSNVKFSGMHRWAEFGDELYMACYPWSYLCYRGRNQVPHSQTHWIAAWIRGLATHYGIPWGVFMEIWEHDVPNRWMPPYWSVGQFYALLAAGVTRLDTFILSFHSEVFGISDERLREFGFEVNKVRPFFPLLAQTQRPRARMAFINPWCQWVMDPQPHYLPPGHEGFGYYRRYAFPVDKLYPNENRRMLAYELFHRTFSDLDQVDEQLLCESPMDYQAIVVSDCRFLMRATMAKLSSFVESGGVLILDCVPERDETGTATDFYRQLTRNPPEESGIIVPGLNYRAFRVGEGSVLCFSASLQLAYGDALEAEREGIRERLERTVAGLLRQLSLTPRWETSCGDVDAALRLTDNACLVPVANLGPDERTARVTLRDLPFKPAFAANLTSGGFLEPNIDEDAVHFDVALGGYRGALFAFFASRPDRCELRLEQQSLSPGAALRYEVLLTIERGTAAAGTFLVNVTVTDGEGRIHHRLGGPLIVRNGAVQFEKRLPVNARPGKWSVAVQDPLIGLTDRRELIVSAD